MNPQPDPQGLRNAYTDTPELHPKLIPGGLQLLSWLFFHPSAWRNHVTRIDPDLRPDFCLAELSRLQWRNPALRRTLVMACVSWPLLVALLVSLILGVLGRSGTDIVYGVAGGVMYAVACAVALGAVGSVAGGVAGSTAGGVVGGVAVGVAGKAAVAMLATAVARSGEIVTADTAPLGIVASVTVGMTVGVAGGVAGSVAGREAARSAARQLGSVVAGVLVSIVLYGVTRGAILYVGTLLTKGIVSAAPGAAVGVTFGAVAGLAVGWRTRKWQRGVAYGVAFGLAGGVTFGLVHGVESSGAYGVAGIVLVGVAGGVGLGAWLGSFFALPYVLAERIAGTWAGAIAGALGGGGALVLWWTAEFESLDPLVVSLSPVCVVLGLAAARWRPVMLYPFTALWNLLLYRADERRAGGHPSLLRRHPAFWDEHQWLPLSGLDEHLVLAMERRPDEGRAAIEYLAAGHQRWAVQAAQIELDARSLERCADVAAIGHAHHGLAAGKLEGPASALLRTLSRLSQDVDAALNQESIYNQRLALSAVEDRLDGLLRELNRSSEPYAPRFHPIAARWRQMVDQCTHELAQEVERRQEIESPYIIGVPLTTQQEIFVGRTDVSAQIERLLLDQGRLPLLLYGQRRMGKTSLLNNLGRLLPSTVVPLFVDLQGPASQASDHAGLLYNIARSVVDSARRQRDLSLPPLTHEALTADPFTCFDEWLDRVEGALGQRTALLTLDEFEALDRALVKGRFDEEAILGTLRHLIQHRPRFKVLLAGSHTLDELQRWAGYLINLQTIRISYLKEDEARQLVERPVRDFALRYEPDASQRVLELTRGHPFLVQLLCAEIVSLKNEQPPAIRRLARLADVETAVPRALSHGSFFFADIQQNQVDAAGLAALDFLAAQGKGVVISRKALARRFPDGSGGALDLLLRRELIEPVEEGYRVQVELVQRWFARHQ
jgi:hypothetical protein